MAGIYKTDYIELRKKMAEKEIRTIKTLSEKSGINRNTLAKILDGTMQPSSDAMEKLAFTLCLTPEEAGRIFFGTNLRIA